MKRLLLVDYSYPDGIDREKYFRELGFEVKFFSLTKSRVWPGESPIKQKIKPFVKLIKPINDLTNKLDVIRLNNELIKITKEFMPEIVLIIKGDTLFTSTIKKIKKISSPILLNWYGDSVFSPGRKEFIYSRIGLFDYFFLIDELEFLPNEITKNLMSRNKNVYTVPFAASTEFLHPIDISLDKKNELQTSISFIGVINPIRKQFLEAISDFNLKIWAPLNSSWGDWLSEDSPLNKRYQKGCIYGEDVVEIYSNSAIVLDIHFLFSKSNVIPNVTTRVYEVPACGGFILTNFSNQLPHLFKVGEEIVCYSNENELKEKSRYYLNNPEERKKIAAKGRERVLRDHMYLNRLKKILSIINVKLNG